MKHILYNIIILCYVDVVIVNPAGTDNQANY